MDTCPWSQTCGGCDLDGVPQDTRAADLRRTVARTLSLEREPAWVDSPRPTAHRARIKLAIEHGRVGYRAARSHLLVEPDTCRIARREIQALLPVLREWVARYGAPFSSVELRSDGTRVACAFTTAGLVPVEVHAALRELGDVAVDGRPVCGHPTLLLDVAGTTLRASPGAFYQVNLEANALLVEHVREALAGCERVLDLYAGIGNLSLPLAARGTPVIAVEAPGPSGDDLVHNATRVAPTTARTVVCRVEAFDPTREAYDGVVIDPPRAGAPGVLARITRQRPRRIALVSCHVASAARDLRALRGYRVVSATCFDLFPATHHVEVVVVLERG